MGERSAEYTELTMPLQTHVNWERIQAGLTACPKKLASVSRHLLSLKLQELDHQAKHIEQDRARIVQLLESIAQEHTDAT
jgi:hypothetical protein